MKNYRQFGNAEPRFAVTGEDPYNVERCDAVCTHTEIIERVRDELPDEDTLYDLTELFRIFGDSTRVRILYLLFASEMCVCDMAALLGLTQSAVSHQLRALKNVRLVKARRGRARPSFIRLPTTT